tara:strand:+ start:475 stop:753 length:279 start_codon:yes stop_codon:yes gene_type:complete
MANWITKEHLEQGRVQAKEIYREFLQDDSQGEQSWNEIIINGQYFDIECWDDDMEKPRTETFCSIYPIYLINDWRETDSEKWIRLFTNKEKS